MAAKRVEIKQLNLSQDTKNDVQKLVSVENSLTELTKQFINKDIDTIENETVKISNFSAGISSILQKIRQYKDQCSKTTDQLQKQVQDLNTKIKTYERDVKNNNKENQYKKQIQKNEKIYLDQWKKRIDIAQKIQVEFLNKIDIQDRKSKANQVFKWIIVTIYGEPQAKYYWPNFKQQIFERDQGKDFKQRLGKINASNAKQQQRIKTGDFLKIFNEVIQCKQLKKAQTQIEKIRNVAQIFLNCYQIANKIRNLQKAIEKSKQQSRERDQQAMRWKARGQALDDRIKVNKQYMSILQKVQSKLNGKTQSYTEKQSMSKEIIEKLKRNQTIPQFTVDVEPQKRDLCECNIF